MNKFQEVSNRWLLDTKIILGNICMSDFQTNLFCHLAAKYVNSGN